MRKFLSRHGNIFYGIIVLLVGIAIGYGTTFLVFKKSAAAENQSQFAIQELREKGYQFISPLLVANPTDEFVPFENQLKQGVFDYVNNANVYSVSVYFQDLNSGQWVGINASDTYNPASLLKVPIMMAYLKEAENNSSLLTQEFPYQTEPADGTNTQFDTLVPNQNYTVNDLITAMIVDSDNGAKYTLLQHIDPTVLLDTFTDLGIQTPTVPNYVISDKTYARFFKILYNATYLDNDMSEKAMELLSESTYKDGIVAGVPASVAVAHKFGQYTGPTEDANDPNAWELSDCGVVYYSSDPYLLCVMTRGANLKFVGPRHTGYLENNLRRSEQRLSVTRKC